jgi:leucyl-tRNA synthetase
MYFFADQGWIEKAHQEPVGRLVYNGYIQAQDGQKMSKSKGNVINPDDLIEQGYGADSLRLFEMFIAPYEQSTNWNTRGVPGTFKFLQRLWALTQEFLEAKPATGENKEVLAVVHRAIKNVSTDLDRLSFNTAVAGLMEAVNKLYKVKADGFSGGTSWEFAVTTMVQLVAPFAPHIAEELWQDLGHSDSVHVSNWPVHDEKYLVTDTMTIVVQVNGKVRAQLQVATDATENEVLSEAKSHQHVQTFIAGKELKKEIYIPGKLVSLVV